MDILTASDDHSAKYKSSISQKRDHFLSVYVQGKWVPISFDSLDYIYCECVESHPAVISDGDDIGFDFPVQQCTFYTDQYVYHDEHTVELRALPHWFGEGYYQKAIDKDALVNSDTNSLGTRNKYTLNIGLDYAEADDTLEAIE